jgi:mannose-6-phosphate isomerase-like protein (cupin superfamily)
MLVRRLTCTGKFLQPGDAFHLIRGATLSCLAWLALGFVLPLHGFAGELDFAVVQVETHQPFQRYDGFQLALLAQTPEVNVRVNRLEDRIKRHTHPSSHHFLYFIKGQVEISVGDQTRVVGAGDFVTIPRGTPHAMYSVGELGAVFLDVAAPPDAGDVIWHE